MLGVGQNIFDIFYPIGTYYETSDTNFDPNIAHSWYGTWVEDTEGQTLVSRNNGTFKTVGANVGEEKHKLTIEEIPTHKHPQNQWIFNGSSASGTHYGYGWQSNTGTMYNNMPSDWSSNGNAGGDKSHNNIQPSKVIIRWHRIA